MLHGFIAKAAAPTFLPVGAAADIDALIVPSGPVPYARRRHALGTSDARPSGSLGGPDPSDRSAIRVGRRPIPNSRQTRHSRELAQPRSPRPVAPAARP